MTSLKIIIDGHEIETSAEGGSNTVLQAAKNAGIYIPTLCHHPSLEAYGSCRLCTVQIVKNGRKKLVTACNYPLEDGLVVNTCTQEIVEIRRMIMELLLARCPKEKRLQEMAGEYGIIKPRFLPQDKKCILCGLCYRVCEELVGVAAINAQNRGVSRDVDTPYGELSQDCIACGACALVCPTNSILDRKNIYPLTYIDIKEMEEEFLCGANDDDLGVNLEMLAAKSSVEGQDGGMVTSILQRGIETGLLDGAIVAQKDERLGAKAALVDEAESILQAKGTKYVRISIIAPLLEALEMGKKRVAVVGTPCQMRTVRKLQRQGYFPEKFPDTEIFLIGLFCFESFDYESLKSRVIELFGIDLDRSEKMQIARGKFIVTAEGKEYSCRVRELGDAVREGCSFCGDLVSRLADISIGSIGSEEGYSTVIVRSERGEKLLNAAQFDRKEISREEIVKLAAIKKKNADKNFAGIVAGLPQRLEAKENVSAKSSTEWRNSGILS
ncbi:MAG: Coenzyme F420 hydrogenase/dehydrogenase, beta subunit C-terminal domain [Methanothrix sp.]|nr:Coenzyme F420 hydrogenase/dehydrogenase, beta subunit C-terminal domain [Methanothrix sp.]MDD4446902.1 Coenzyme F420 hydrogenase/dehydrogenase, beta subunit C-terminal domain [Methanothrix sp.]